MERRTLLTSLLALASVGTAKAQTKPIVLLAGATGKNGSVILAALKKSPYQVRAMSRNATEAAAKFGKDVEWVSADVTKPETLPAALKGVTYVIDAVAARGKEGQDSPESVDLGGTKNLAAAAKAAGVKRLVIITSSVSGEVDNPLNKIAGNVIIFKGKAEEALIASGIEYTIIGPGGMNNDPGGKLDIKVLPRAEYVKNTWITREDTALVAIESLTNPGAANKAFSIVNGDGPATGAWKQAFARMPAK